MSDFCPQLPQRSENRRNIVKCSIEGLVTQVKQTHDTRNSPSFFSAAVNREIGATGQTFHMDGLSRRVVDLVAAAFSALAIVLTRRRLPI